MYLTSLTTKNFFLGFSSRHFANNITYRYFDVSDIFSTSNFPKYAFSCNFAQQIFVRIVCTLCWRRVRHDGQQGEPEAPNAWATRGTGEGDPPRCGRRTGVKNPKKSGGTRNPPGGVLGGRGRGRRGQRGVWVSVVPGGKPGPRR